MRTEANKMHKSIPLRKQETHSASLMTDLGLSLFKEMKPSGIPVGEIARYTQLSPDETASFRWRAVFFEKKERGYSGLCNLLIF